MSTTKDLRLAHFVKTLLDIGFGALIFACVGLVLWITLSPVILHQFDIAGSASVPVFIGSGEKLQLGVIFTTPDTDTIQASFIEDAEGVLRLETKSILLLFIANAAKLLTGIGLAYIVNLLRGILKNILDGDPFAADNIQRMRRLGYSVLLLGILRPSVEYIAATEILNQLPATTPALNPGATFNTETILISLLILLLAYIWKYGLELERDKALTV